MNKKLPYEESLERQLGNMSLPDEDTAWQRMQELLDEKKKRRPFAFLYSYTGKSMMSLLAVLGFLVVMHATRHHSGSAATKQADSRTHGQKLSENPAFLTPAANNPGAAATPVALKPQKPAEQPAPAGTPPLIPSLPPAHPVAGSGLSSLNKANTLAVRKVRSARANTVVKAGVAPEKFQSGRRGGAGRSGLVAPAGVDIAASRDIFPAVPAASARNQVQVPRVAFGPMAAHQPDALRLRLAASASDPKNKAGKDVLSAKQHASLFVQAGIGVQQQIPVGGQKTNAFNLNGNKNPLSDYIPSFFLRLEKERRWYVQAEFSYASPQLVKDFSYSRQTLADSAFRTVTTSLLLKKIFYHELPLSFNYYLGPRWTAGAGATYSWFRSAVSEKETVTRNLQTQSGTVDKEIVPIGHYTDSFLYRSHTYLMVQTNYQWQNASAGLRFSKGVQPYIKYTQPDGTVIDRKNWSLELLVRLGLWRSKKF